MSISDQLRAATEARIADGTTRYAIAKATVIDYSTLARWLDRESDLKLDTAAKIADYLELDLLPRATPPAQVDPPAKRRK